MMYNRTLPSMHNLKKLADWDGPFPMKGYRIVIGADRYGFDDDTIHFLKLFPHDAVFRDRDDFLRLCEELEILIRSEWERSAAIVSSPQGYGDAPTRA